MPRQRSARTAASDLHAIAAQAVQLSRADRLELIAILQAFNEAEELAAQEIDAHEQTKQQALDRRGIRGGLRGYGPYRYLRYWYGKTHKSVYIGKVKGNSSETSS